MKLKLSYIQFMALLNMLTEVAQSEPPQSMEAKLYHILLCGVYQKFFVRSVLKKKKYSIAITPAEALAFWFVFNGREVNNAPFESNLLLTVCNSIHQKLS